MKRDLAAQERKLAAAKAAAATLEEQITELQRKVLDAGGPRLKQAKAKAEAANNKLNDAVGTQRARLPAIPRPAVT